MRSANIGYDTVGQVGVLLARFWGFGDDVLRISTLKGKGKKYVGLNPLSLKPYIPFYTSWTVSEV